MKLRELWKTYNVSTLLVLPLYSDICKDSVLKMSKKYAVPFVQLCFEYGLKQTYLEEDRFIMLFDRKVIEENKLTHTTGYSLLEHILGYDKFLEVLDDTEDSIAFSFELPEEFEKDLERIRNSEYSKVSETYKEKLRITQNRIAILENELSNTIVAYNIPLSITIKARHLKKELADVLEVSEDVLEKELYSVFDKNKEIWQK